MPLNLTRPLDVRLYLFPGLPLCVIFYWDRLGLYSMKLSQHQYTLAPKIITDMWQTFKMWHVTDMWYVTCVVGCLSFSFFFFPHFFLQTRMTNVNYKFPHKKLRNSPWYFSSFFCCNLFLVHVWNRLASPLCLNLKQTSCDMGHVTWDTWHVTRDTWHVTHGGRWTSSQNCRSLAHTVWEWRLVEDLEKKDLLTNHESVCRTALATLGLLKNNFLTFS